jgi:hypothetical protein
MGLCICIAYKDAWYIILVMSSARDRQDYYQSMAALDPGSENLYISRLGLTQQCTLRQWVEELNTPGLEQSRHDEILDIKLANIK